MPLTGATLPFGLRDVKVRPLTGETAGTSVDLPNSRTFSFSEASDTAELRGDDAVIAIHDLGNSVDWELEEGGIDLAAVKVMYGGTIIDSGTTPNQVRTFRRLATDVRPYFQVEGQAISDSGGDVHIVLYRCKATGELSGELTDGDYWLTGASGRAVGRASDQRLYDFVANETVTAIV